MNSLLQTLRNLGPTRLAVMGGAVVVVVGFLVYLITATGTGNMSLLYGELDNTDLQQVRTVLDRGGVPYKVQGNSIYVPEDQVTASRMTLGEAGLPSGGTVQMGNQLFNDMPMTSDQFQKRIAEKRALEGELARTVSSLDAIDTARVHLVLPRREIFSRNERQPSASVTVRVRGNKRLQDGQIQSIQQVVAAAVPNLKPTRIAVVDENGRLYSTGVEDEASLYATRAEQQMRRWEEVFSSKVAAAVSRLVGPDHYVVEASIDMDFNRETIIVDEPDADTQVAASTQTVSESAEATETQGVDPVTVASNLPDANSSLGTGAGRYEKSQREEETVNYTVGRTRKESVRETGEIERLSLAVIVDKAVLQEQIMAQVTTEQLTFGQEGVDYTINAETGEKTATGLTAAQLEAEVQERLNEIRTHAAGSINLNADRGDQLMVLAQPFYRPLEEMEGVKTILGMPEEDFWQLVNMFALAAVALLVILLVVRPLIQRALEASQEDEALPGTPSLPERPGAPALGGPDMARLDESAEMEALEQMIDINQVEGRVRASSLRKIGEIVDKHPEEAVAILRSWMYQEA